MKIEVTVDEITLDTMVASAFVYDDEGELVPDGKSRSVADLVAEKITDRITADFRYNSLRDAVLRIRDEEIRTAVQPLIQEALTRPRQRTNTWGDPVGEETTLTRSSVMRHASSSSQTGRTGTTASRRTSTRS